jgi:hypothetical protein
MALTDAERRAYVVQNGESDLVYLLEDARLPIELQHAVILAGYSSIRTFIGIDDSRPEVRVAFQQLLTLNPAVPAERLSLALLLSVWETATLYHTKESQLRAEAKVMGITRPASTQERTAMRRMVEQRYGRLPTAETPSASYVSDKLEECEQNEPHAARLDEVLSLDDLEEQTLGAGLDSTGKVHIVRRRGKIHLPSTPEELRTRLRVEANLWLMMQVKFPNRPWLANLTQLDFAKYTDYFLGKRVHGIEIAGGAVRPPWELILSYEFECRKFLFLQVREENENIHDLLEAVVRNVELKQLHFLTALAISPKRTKTLEAGDAWREDKKARKKKKKSEAALAGGSGKGKDGKGKGKKGDKGKGGGKSTLEWNTPDGRPICFAYNDKGCAGGCGRVHICRVKGCGASHPMQEHP